MSDWMKLSDYPSDAIRRGSILRVPSRKKFDGTWYVDDFMDFLIFDAQSFFSDAGYGLMVLSGQKAGLVNTTLPLESMPVDGIGLSKDWLVANWTKWVYLDGVVADVWIRDPQSVTEMPDGRQYERI